MKKKDENDKIKLENPQNTNNTKVIKCQHILFSDLKPNFFKTKNKFRLSMFEYPDFASIDTNKTIPYVTHPQSFNSVVITISSLLNADTSSIDLFIFSSVPLIKSAENQLERLQICGNFVYMLSILSPNYPSHNILSILWDTDVFDPSYHIFYKNQPLSEMINLLRIFIFDTISQKDPIQFLLLLEKSAKFPFLFCEFLFRILKDIENIDITMLMDEKIFHSIIENCHFLLNLQEKMDESEIELYDIQRAREINFIFIFYLVQHKETQIQCISSKDFTDGFLWFIYEEDMTEKIILLLRDVLSEIEPEIYAIELITSFITKFCISIQTNNKENFETLGNQNNLVKIIEHFSSELISGLQSNCYSLKLVPYFEIVFHQFIKVMEDYPSPIIIESCFSYIEMLIQNDELNDYEITPFIISNFSKIIKKCYNNEPPMAIRHHLQYILTKQYSTIGDYQMFIKCPSSIPFFIACYGSSKQIDGILNQFYKLCEFSAFNEVQMHDGNLDLILLNYLSKREKHTIISYKGADIELNLENNEIVYKLLVKISTCKSNACIVNQFLDLITQIPTDFNQEQIFKVCVSECEVISAILQKCYTKPIPNFSIGTIHPQFTVSNIPILSLRDGFTIHFQLLVDNMLLDESDDFTINLLTFRDLRNTSLSISIRHHSILGLFETEDAMSDVELVQKIPSKPFDFACSCVYIEEEGEDGETYTSIQMKPYIDGIPNIEYNLGSEYFFGHTLTLTIGGIEKNPEIIRSQPFPKNSLIGTIGDITILRFALDEKSIQNLIHGQRDSIFEIFSSTHMKFHNVDNYPQANSFYCDNKYDCYYSPNNSTNNTKEDFSTDDYCDASQTYSEFGSFESNSPTSFSFVHKSLSSQTSSPKREYSYKNSKLASLHTPSILNDKHSPISSRSNVSDIIPNILIPVPKSSSLGSISSYDSMKHHFDNQHTNVNVNVSLCGCGIDAATHDFLWYFVDSSFLNKIISFFEQKPSESLPIYYPQYILDIINLIFTASETSQASFNGVKKIQKFFFNNPRFLTYKLFYCTCSILSSLTNKKLFVEWLTKIVLSTWIWIQCPNPQDIVKIFKYYFNFLVKKYKTIITSSLNVSLLVDQFFLFFCFSNEEIYINQIKKFGNNQTNESIHLVFEREDLISDLPFKLSNKTIKALYDSRDYFSSMIQQIIPSKCDRFDIQALVIHLFSAKSNKSKLYMMKFLCCVSSESISLFDQQEETIKMLRPLIMSNDLEIVKTSIILTIKLSNKENISYLTLSSIMIAKYVPPKELFNSLLPELINSPNLIYILAVLAISLKEEMPLLLVDEIHKIKNNFKSLLLFDNWFIWLILLSFSIDNYMKQEIIGKFIANILLQSNEEQMKSDLTKIFLLIDLFECFSTTQYKNRIIISLLKQFYKKTNSHNNPLYQYQDLPPNPSLLDPDCYLPRKDQQYYQVDFSQMIQTFIDMIFMHMRCISFNDALIETYKSSCFNDINNSKEASKIQQSFSRNIGIHTQDLRTPDAFDVFICSDFNDFFPHFCILINENKKWINKDQAQLVLDLFKKHEINDQSLKLYSFLIEHFVKCSNSCHLEDELHGSCYDILKKLNSFVDDSNIKFKEIFSKTLSEIRSQVHNMIIEAHSISDNLTDPKQVTDVQQLKINYGDMSFTKLQVNLHEILALNQQIIHNKDIFERDWTACAYLCPMKLKKLELHNKHRKTNYFAYSFSSINYQIKQKENEAPLFQQNCILIRFSKKTNYTFKLYKTHILLSSNDDRSNSKLIINDSIIFVLSRKIENRETGIEIFTKDGGSYLIDLVTVEHPSLINALFLLKLPNIQILQRNTALETFSKLQITELWTHGLISNFEYIVKMNIVSGRSFNNSSIYPIFPSLLNNIEDIKHSSNFTKYKQWNLPVLDRIKYPIDQNSPNEITSLPECCCTNTLLTPEYYYFPYIIISEDELPEWCHKSKFEFVYKHRKLLESDAVSNRLHIWFDNIFGVRAIKIPHRQLFRTPHPQKIIFLRKQDKKPFSIDSKIGSKHIVYSALTQQDNPFSYKFVTIFDDGTVQTCSISGKNIFEQQEQQNQLTTTSSSNSNNNNTEKELNTYYKFKDYNQIGYIGK